MIKRATRFKGTSFHHVTIITTPRKLMDLADKIGATYYAGNDGEDKTNFDFDFETEDGVYFTVYDWKEYRILDLDKTVEFHIGGESASDCRIGKEILNESI